MSQKELAKLNFYQMVMDLPPNERTCARFADQLRVSTTTIYRNWQTITNDLHQFIRPNEQPPKLLEASSAPPEHDIPAARYAVYLMRHSLVGDFLRSVLTHPERTLDDIAKAHELSTSTATRRLRPLRNFLAKFDVNLTYSPIGIEGYEPVVRLTLSQLIWQIDQDGVTLFPYVEAQAQKVTRQLRTAHLVVNNCPFLRVQNMVTIAILRNQQGHAMPALPPLHKILQVTGYNGIVGTRTEFVAKHPADTALIHLESLLIGNFHSEADPDLQRLLQYHNKSNSASWRLVSGITQRARTLVGFSGSHRNKVLLANMLAVTVVLEIIDHKVPTFDPLALGGQRPTSPALERMLRQYFATLPPSMARFQHIASSLIVRYIPLMTSVVNLGVPTIGIALDPEQEQQVYSALIEIARSVPSVQIVANPRDADIVVTTRLNADPRYFTLAPHSRSSWLALEKRVHDCVGHKSGLAKRPEIAYTVIERGEYSNEQKDEKKWSKQS
ncbi:helix-turn-helix domain-containing protein [Lacticaseibacillus thailandensis]|uniref:helix-turn-helix domain-containing protein n=1 Tax=Lacticaseibacillus thailandensis TaxID=381741 RepID=UPI0012E1A90F|nr:helix-turn-helix domain-containing protein [Lacticaseibacillus thailandensis]